MYAPRNALPTKSFSFFLLQISLLLLLLLLYCALSAVFFHRFASYVCFNNNVCIFHARSYRFTVHTHTTQHSQTDTFIFNLLQWTIFLYRRRQGRGTSVSQQALVSSGGPKWFSCVPSNQQQRRRLGLGPIRHNKYIRQLLWALLYTFPSSSSSYRRYLQLWMANDALNIRSHKRRTHQQRIHQPHTDLKSMCCIHGTVCVCVAFAQIKINFPKLVCPAQTNPLPFFYLISFDFGLSTNCPTRTKPVCVCVCARALLFKN